MSLDKADDDPIDEDDDGDSGEGNEAGDDGSVGGQSGDFGQPDSGEEEAGLVLIIKHYANSDV